MDEVARRKLLLADDSVTIRKVVELTFADEGIDVSTVADAEAAMQRFVEIQPDIVLVDVGLSGTSGYRICEMIKQDEVARHIPVLLLVGSFERFDEAEAERVGADGYLTKPFHSIRDLVVRVKELLENESGSLSAVAETIAEPVVDDGWQAEPRITTPETADIDHLYRDSFAKTVEIEEFETVDDLLGDSSLDDEMIETSYPTPEVLSSYAYSNTGDEVVMSRAEFDWSPESKITSATSEPSCRASTEPVVVAEELLDIEIVEDSDRFNLGTFGSDNYLGLDNFVDKQESTDSWDARVSEHSVSGGFDGEINGLATSETSQFNGDGELNFEEDVKARSPRFEPHNEDFDSIENAAVANEIDRVDDAGFAIVPGSLSDTSGQSVEHSQHPDGPVSDEIIDLIVQQVIARLSDSVVREVAQIEVPKVAEKLIREALQDDKT